MRFHLVGLAAVLMTSGSNATDLPDVTIHAVASGATLRTGFAGHGSHVLPEIIYLKGDFARVEFQDGRDSEHVLRDGKVKNSWLVNEARQFVLPLGNGPTARQYFFPLERPCADFGGTCSKLGPSAVAGRAVIAWRYRNAGHGGPDGSDSGTMFLDTENGLLLGYDSADLSGRPMKWTVTSVDFGKVDPVMFTLPKAAPKKQL